MIVEPRSFCRSTNVPTSPVARLGNKNRSNGESHLTKLIHQPQIQPRDSLFLKNERFGRFRLPFLPDHS
jgi:hypothetical protein